MRMRKLGALEVSELGFGILSFASTYGQAPEKAESTIGLVGARMYRFAAMRDSLRSGEWPYRTSAPRDTG